MAYLSRLTLTNFRSFEELELALPAGVVVLAGDNAQGKTTLLEAIYLLAIARSFRAESEREVVRFETGGQGGQALVGGDIELDGERQVVYVGYQAMPRNSQYLNGQARDGRGKGTGFSIRKEIRVSRARKTAAELVGTVNAVLFTAEDIQLVFGPPSGRRRYLNILVSQSDPAYLRSLQRYQRVVQQRNRLLRLIGGGGSGADELAFWDDELVREGGWLTWRRAQVVAALGPLCEEQHGVLGGPGEELSVEYRPSVPLGADLTETEQNFREALASEKGKERATASTAVGPHRDDLGLLINGLDMRAYASRGQARTMALALRLAEGEYLAGVRGEGPIVLLDDVLSEMDGTHRRRVLEQVTRFPQTVVTTTELRPVAEYFGESAHYYRVAEGRVAEMSYDEAAESPRAHQRE